MKKVVSGIRPVIGLVFFGLSAVGFAEGSSSLDEAIRGAKTTGQFRLGYINVDPDVAGGTTTSATAIGGHIKLETKEWNRLRFALAPYFSEKISALSGDEASGKLNGDFFDINNDSYAYLGEAYVEYNWSQGTLIFGRQQLDNPFINTDDIRMHPNTFEAIWVTLAAINNFSIEGGFVNRWAGFDSGGSQDKFKDASNDGVLAVGAAYQMKTHHTFHGWYYDFDGAYQQIYFDGVYRNGAFEAGVQITDYSEDSASGIQGQARGLMASYDFGVVKAGVAYNDTSNDAGKSVNLGLGGGNFFTSMDETTIADKTDASAYMLSVEYPATEALSLTAAYGHFEDANKATTDLDEMNLILSYALDDKIEIGFIYTDVDNKAQPADADTNFSRQLLIANYNF